MKYSDYATRYNVITRLEKLTSTQQLFVHCKVMGAMSVEYDDKASQDEKFWTLLDYYTSEYETPQTTLFAILKPEVNATLAKYFPASAKTAVKM